ncbi:uncharacterized protein Z520_05487 [Fonsecaea multimorphosa CBS 102226]|uniref:Uncharacterized protein n=1 Tax=Fonsecaea multimorphosa CBS 102226 TaxID=1442371 RepID=A0A0D2IQ08_9EURO|nr:uncharacterized protein Z520_05487 [Fonsecaea multimorphosa CBS 102226]KIX99026.1 hypothetical protein Z520_05487 [Fonsecaea multimorphosa CBS 102226]
MPLDLAYLGATDGVWAAFDNNHQQFFEQKIAFESLPNVKLSRSLDHDGRPINVAQASSLHSDHVTRLSRD